MKKEGILKEINNIKNQLIEKYRPEEVEERLALGDPFVKKVFKKGKVLYGWLTLDIRRWTLDDGL